jgi:putative protease
LDDFEHKARLAIDAGVDAVLVQDLGAARVLAALCPDWPIHASTQMTLTSAECIEAVATLGVRRVVLPRELSIAEIAKIHRRTSVELEAFVHGALCVAYSGQCLTSESLGGRSANRGQCAQACRMPYRLICDGEERDLDDQKYLLSPQDLAAFDLVPRLIEAGVSGFKIEGRLKTAEYVANITRNYRTAIDAAAGRPAVFTPVQVEEMQLSFSRGFSHGWLEGCDHKRLVPGLSSANRGVLLGRVKGAGKGRVRIELASSIKRGDGIVFDGDRMADAEQGSRVYEVFVQGRSLEESVSSGVVDLTFGHGAIDIEKLRADQKVWKTDDPELSRRLRKTFAGPDPQRRVDLDIEVRAAVGSPLRITARAASGAACSLESVELLEEARKHPLSADLLREQLGRLGGTVYQLRQLEARIEGRPMAPLSVLGKLRHELVRRIDAAVAERPRRGLAPESPLPALRAAARAAVNSSPPLAGIRLHVLCRCLEQVPTLLDCGVTSLIVDFQDIRQYAAAVQLAHAGGAEIFIATPRIQKPAEMGIFRVLARHGADGILARNLAGLAFFREQQVRVAADFSLNAANELSVRWLREQGAQRVAAAYDMNRDQLLDMIAAVPPEWLEIVVHQHMPMFHMEHCVFCAVLSPGTNKTNCGRPCDRHKVLLRDHLGAEHPLAADVGCRNTLFNATPQSAAEIVSLLVKRGVQDFRIELLDSAEASDPRELIALYRDLLADRITGREVWSRLKAVNRVGVTRGTLEARRDPLAIL